MDITARINEFLEGKNVKSGLCRLFLEHTTAALTTADLDSGTDLDTPDAFEAMMPKLKYRHPHNPNHIADHILSSMMGASLLFPVQNGVLISGQWQRVVIAELDGPREREIVASLIESL